MFFIGWHVPRKQICPNDLYPDRGLPMLDIQLCRFKERLQLDNAAKKASKRPASQAPMRYLRRQQGPHAQ